MDQQHLNILLLRPRIWTIKKKKKTKNNNFASKKLKNKLLWNKGLCHSGCDTQSVEQQQWDFFPFVIMSLQYSVGRVSTGLDARSVPVYPLKIPLGPGSFKRGLETEINLKYYNTTGSISRAISLEATRTASRPRRGSEFTALQCWPSCSTAWRLGPRIRLWLFFLTARLSEASRSSGGPSRSAAKPADLITDRPMTAVVLEREAGWVQHDNPGAQNHPVKFGQYFRLFDRQFEGLLRQPAPRLQREGTNYWEPIDPKSCHVIISI